MNNVLKLTDEILKKLKEESSSPSSKDKPKFSLQDPKNVAYRKKYIGTEYEFLGLSLPQESLVYKRGFENFKAENFQEKAALWRSVWNESHHYHVMSQALSGLSKLETEVQTKNEHLVLLNTIAAALKKLDNWAHSDGVSSMLARLLERAQSDKALLALHLKFRTKWNKSKNPWERRQSIVSLLYYASAREKYLPYKKMLPLVDALIEDEAFYVQRGVGWTLRELYNVYPKETYAYLVKNISKLSAIAFSASTEKLTKKDKDLLKKLRIRQRANKKS
ncbi:MAG: DNA alkylation repair protein [Bdellovibrionota bacterium]